MLRDSMMNILSGHMNVNTTSMMTAQAMAPGVRLGWSLAVAVRPSTAQEVSVEEIMIELRRHNLRCERRKALSLIEVQFSQRKTHTDQRKERNQKKTNTKNKHETKTEKTTTTLQKAYLHNNICR